MSHKKSPLDEVKNTQGYKLVNKETGRTLSDYETFQTVLKMDEISMKEQGRSCIADREVKQWINEGMEYVKERVVENDMNKKAKVFQEYKELTIKPQIDNYSLNFSQDEINLAKAVKM